MSRWLLLPAFAAMTSVVNAAESDPWEKVNRGVFSFNEVLDRFLLKPVAQGYQWVMPQPLDDGITNFFENLGELETAVNNVAQFKLGAAANDVGRFAINSTVGVAGFIDVAARMGLAQNQEDLGQTLGYWGVPSGPYVMLPFAGPSTVRDTSASLIEFGAGLYDISYQPLDLLTWDYQWTQDIRPDFLDVPAFTIPELGDVSRGAVVKYSLQAIDVIDARADLIAYESFLKGDRYDSLREAYLSSREFAVKDGVVKDAFISEGPVVEDDTFDDLDFENMDFEDMDFDSLDFDNMDLDDMDLDSL